MFCADKYISRLGYDYCQSLYTMEDSNYTCPGVFIPTDRSGFLCKQKKCGEKDSDFIMFFCGYTYGC